MADSNGLTIDVEVIGFANHSGRPRLMARPHRHNEVELNFVEKGKVTYLFGGTRAEIHSGQVAVFWAAIPHQTIEVSADTVYHWLTIPFASFLQWRLPDPLVQQVICNRFVLHSPPSATPLALFRQWHTDLQANTEEHHKIVLLEVEAFLRRVALVLPTPDLSEPSAQQGKIAPHTLSNIELMASFIADHYTEPLHSNDIAAAAHLHPNYAMNLFRKHFGISMMEYLTHYRVAHAQRLLITTEMNVSQIALEAGFGSVSRFYSVFKTVCGQLPGEYRNRLRAQAQ